MNIFHFFSFFMLVSPAGRGPGLVPRLAQGRGGLVDVTAEHGGKVAGGGVGYAREGVVVPSQQTGFNGRPEARESLQVTGTS